jgi:hypothetical protein
VGGSLASPERCRTASRRARLPLAEGLAQTFRWYLANARALREACSGTARLPGNGR